MAMWVSSEGTANMWKNQQTVVKDPLLGIRSFDNSDDGDAADGLLLS